MLVLKITLSEVKETFIISPLNLLKVLKMIYIDNFFGDDLFSVEVEGL